MLTDEIAYERKTIPQAWSEEQKAKLMRMRLVEGRDWDEIAVELGRSVPAVKSKFKYEAFQQQKLRQVSESVTSDRTVPRDVVAEQVRRLSAPSRDIAGAVFGDPPVGFSALDR